MRMAMFALTAIVTGAIGFACFPDSESSDGNDTAASTDTQSITDTAAPDSTSDSTGSSVWGQAVFGQARW